MDASVIKADVNRANVTTSEEPKAWPGGDNPSRAVRDYLTALDEANPIGEDASAIVPSRTISLSDPQARYTAAPGGPAFFAYSTNYLIDLDAGIIMYVEATQAHRTQEVESTKTMVQRV